MQKQYYTQLIRKKKHLFEGGILLHQGTISQCDLQVTDEKCRYIQFCFDKEKSRKAAESRS